MVGIITNIAAQSVQYNLNKANADSQASISRLSSGNAISKASDNVAGLAVGTALKTNVSTLKSALTNTAQATSMLGVADGALQNIGEILQRQKQLSTQAGSSSLTSVTRSYINQEFQNLNQEIDRISNTTNFNGINLIDGSLYAPSNLNTQTTENAISAKGKLTMGATTAANNNTVAINGVTFTYATTPSGPKDLALASGATAAGNLYNAIKNVLTSTSPALASDKAKLAQLDFELSGANLNITSKSAGTAANGINIVGGGSIGATTITVNGTDLNTTATVALNTGGVAGVNGNLSAGTFPTTGTAYSGTATTIAQGTIGDNILTAITTTAAATTGINTSGISNNADFVGNIQGFKAAYTVDGYADLKLTVGDKTYQSVGVQTNPTAATVIRMSSVEDGGGYFDIQIDASTNTGQAAIQNQSDADLFATRLDKALSSVSFHQNRQISSYTAAGTVYPTGSSTASGNLSGTKFNLINSNFDNTKIESVKVQAPVAGGSNASIQVVINGETYSSGYDSAGSTSALGTTITANSTIGLVSQTDPKKVLVFTNGATDLTLDNSDKAAGLQKALTSAFGINEGASNLSFQVGTTADDSIGISIKSTQTKDIYLDSQGRSQSISVDSIANASKASDILDNAINSVTEIRANIGAAQSRFNYAASNLNVAIQNQDAARGTFLDTDMSVEATNYAQSQVRVQASISVLAQANQLPQSLLKLIG